MPTIQVTKLVTETVTREVPKTSTVVLGQFHSTRTNNVFTVANGVRFDVIRARDGRHVKLFLSKEEAEKTGLTYYKASNGKYLISTIKAA